MAWFGHVPDLYTSRGYYLRVVPIRRNTVPEIAAQIDDMVLSGIRNYTRAMGM